MRNSGLEEAQAGIKIAGRNINNLRYADDTSLMAESDRGFPGGSDGKESACNAGDLGSILGSGQSLSWNRAWGRGSPGAPGEGEQRAAPGVGRTLAAWVGVPVGRGWGAVSVVRSGVLTAAGKAPGARQGRNRVSAGYRKIDAYLYAVRSCRCAGAKGYQQ